ncbi:MAG: hypothetical protein IPH37_08860 [Burkholderiales bacterium]|nr:hypothetical protein [Burkholderiales bacterium]
MRWISARPFTRTPRYVLDVCQDQVRFMASMPQGRVRFGLPQHALRFLFPRLWPEAQADCATP